MSKKKVVIALGHRALGTTMPEQYKATRNTAKAIADLVEAGADVVISHSNAPQVGMIHTAMNEFSKDREDYTQAPMSVCSAMSQGYIGYDLQNAIREELMNRGIYRTVSTVLTQVTFLYVCTLLAPGSITTTNCSMDSHVPRPRCSRPASMSMITTSLLRRIR